MKHEQKGPVAVGPLGLAGDEQGDQIRHGGPDKAILVYAEEHYPYWRQRLGRDVPVPGFGENLTVRGLTEEQACIGDVLQIGQVVAEVTQARQPCFKIAARYTLPKIAKWVQDAGFTGYYLRVLEPGSVQAGDSVERLVSPHPALPISEINRLLYRDRRDGAGMRRALAAEQFAAQQRAVFEQRLGGPLEDFEIRLYGSDEVLTNAADAG
ncbi:Protein YiiM [Capillimicrobium parvum]|uniref:Protein YiiM n=1 Tax=Capillimicrobium parvum TaxID=2884022 RepID=A0A9E6XSK3_9ACTN|nr:Protein YiiM [Capillimicrobium parvum]